jgi:hypothetical protein
MKPITMVILFIFACLTPSELVAEIYFWTDENGVRHYSDTPPADIAVQIKTARKIQSDPQALESKEKLDEENFEAMLEEQDKADQSSTPAAGEAQRDLSRQERIQIEQEKLEEKLAYLENLPPESFSNSRSRLAIIGRVRYRLEQLLSDPDGYFEKYGY